MGAEISQGTELDVYMSTISAITYRDGKILKQESVSEPLDYDPSEGQDWNWEDYE